MNKIKEGIRNLNTTKFEIKFELSSLSEIGTCLAGNMLRCFHYNNYTTQLSPWGVIPNPFVIRNEIKRLFIKNQQGFILKNSDGTYSDSSRTWKKFDSIIEMEKYNEEFDRIALNHLQNSSAIFISYGLTEIWSPTNNPDIVLNRLPDKTEELQENLWINRLADVTEVKDCIFETINILREYIGPEYPIIFCVCPAGLKYTFSAMPLKTADNHSKSSLYTILQMAVKEFDKVVYFPAYEYGMLSKCNKSVYQPDGRHYTAKGIEGFCKLFSAFFQKVVTFKSGFSVPFYNENGMRCGRLYSNGKIKME